MAKVTVNRTSAELARAVKAAIAAIDSVEADLGIQAPALSPSSKRHTARYRKGGDEMIGHITSIAQQNRLESPTLPVSDMTDQLAIATAIGELITRVTTFQTGLANAVFSARAHAWQTAMQYYALLQRVARSNRKIAAKLAPVKKFMSVHDPRPKRHVGEPSRTQVRAAKRAQKVLADQAEVAARKKKA